LGEELGLPSRIADLTAKGLVGDVVGAQAVAVAQESLSIAERDQGGFGQDFEFCTPGKIGAEQEVAVAGHEKYAATGIGEGCELSGDPRVERIVEVVIAGPIFEEIAQDVKGAGRPGGAGEVAFEYGGERRALGAQMQIGNEMDIHVPAAFGFRWGDA
jgi:hypothetical protein